jgi:hypothetical protein
MSKAGAGSASLRRLSLKLWRRYRSSQFLVLFDPQHFLVWAIEMKLFKRLELLLRPENARDAEGQRVGRSSRGTLPDLQSVNPTIAATGSVEGGKSSPDKFPQLCTRCHDLGIDELLTTKSIRSHAPIYDHDTHGNWCPDPAHRAVVKKKFHYVSGPDWHIPTDGEHRIVITPVGDHPNVQFDRDCSFCIFVREMVDTTTLNPNEPLYLIPATSVHRLEPDYGADTSRHYPNHLYFGQKINDRGQTRLPYTFEVHNGFGYESSQSPYERPLGTIVVNPNQVEICFVHRWLNLCNKHHKKTCETPKFEELGIIRLIDVLKRKVVSYHETNGEYLCLSYVWGQCEGDVELCNPPATILDAMDFVHKLGKRWLWVDMVRHNLLGDCCIFLRQ